LKNDKPFFPFFLDRLKALAHLQQQGIKMKENVGKKIPQKNIRMKNVVEV
jgi:hypothetical protein